MKRPKLVTVVLPAHGVEGAIASVVRDLAVAAYALRSRDMELDVLLLAGGGDRTAMWTAFARRGMGADAAAGGSDPAPGFSSPARTDESTLRFSSNAPTAASPPSEKRVTKPLK